eukprot:scaffold61103_cov17-Tisochrysis_lutea.AAC.1
MRLHDSQQASLAAVKVAEWDKQQQVWLTSASWRCRAIAMGGQGQVSTRPRRSPRMMRCLRTPPKMKRGMGG